MKRKRIICLVMGALFASSCANMDLSGLAEDAGESQRRQDCMAEFKNPPCPQDGELPHDGLFDQ